MNSLYHHGIKGQRWYVRRYQNEDGSYTEKGKQHYGIGLNYRKSKMYKSTSNNPALRQALNRYYTGKRREVFGEKGAARIAKDRAKGYSETKARDRENTRRMIPKYVAMATPVVAAAAGITVAALVQRRARLNRGGYYVKMANGVMAIAMGAHTGG